MKIKGKALTLMLALSMITTAGSTAYADQKVMENNNITDPYIYKIDSRYTYQYRSPHRCSVVTEEEIIDTLITAMYRLENTVDKKIEVGYCCDLSTSINTEGPGIVYKRMNLEDAGYYDKDSAGHIRAILENGYWHEYGGPTQKESEKLKALAAACGIPESEILTAAEALSATQQAIWYYANSDPVHGKAKVERQYTKSKDVPRDKIADYNTVDVDEKAGTHVGEHIEKVFSYLKGLDAATPTSVIWDFEGQGVLVAAKVGTDENILYDATVRFKMSGSEDETEGLSVTATPYMKAGLNVIQPQEIALKDLVLENGYYTITFSDLTRQQLYGIEKIIFTLDGTQELKEDVYFYEPKGGRTVSQCFVGIASGETPIHREWEMGVSLTEKTLNLFKHENNSEDPVSGAKFQLFARLTSNGESVSIGDEMETDENGNITWTALASADNISYYCVETQAPTGYEKDSAEHHFDKEGKITVSNCHDVGDVVITKTVRGTSSCEAAFKFKVELNFGKAVLKDRLTDDEMTVNTENIEWSGDGDIKTAYITLKNGEFLIIKNLPVGTECNVTELDEMGNISGSGDNILVYSGIPYSPADINMKKVIESGLNEITITNCEYGEAYTVINGKKYLDGKESGIPFEFCIAQVNDDGIRGEILQKVSNNKNGNFSFNPISYKKPGIYKYEVWESSKSGGYISDATVYSVKVVVQKDSQNNKLILDETSSEFPDIVFKNTTRTFVDYDRVSVTKKWKLDNGGSTSPVQVQLLKDGKVYDTVTLSDERGWSYSWNYLSKGPKWTVEEVNIPEGFAASVTKSAYSNDFTITNDDVKPAPTSPAGPIDPTKPEQSTKPEKPAKPGDPANTTNPTKPCKPDTEVPKTEDTASDAMLINTFAFILSALGGMVIWHRRKEKN